MSGVGLVQAAGQRLAAFGLTSACDADLRRDTFAAFFAKESPPEVVRAAEPSGVDPALWERARALGVPAMATGGATLADLAVLAEEAGRHLAPIPLLGNHLLPFPSPMAGTPRCFCSVSSHILDLSGLPRL